MQDTANFRLSKYIELYEFAVAIIAKDTFQWHQKDIDIELSRYKIIQCINSFFHSKTRRIFVPRKMKVTGKMKKINIFYYKNLRI